MPPTARGQFGRMYELNLLVALVAISIAVGLGQRSWFAAIAVLLGIPLGLFALITVWEVTDRLWTSAKLHFVLSKFHFASAIPAKRLHGVKLICARGYRYTRAPRFKARIGELLLDLLDDSDVEVRVAAAGALCTIEFAIERAIPVLVEAVTDGERRAEALNFLDRLRPRAGPRLRELIPNSETSGWYEVLRTLAPIGAAAGPAVPTMLKWLDDMSSDEIYWSVQVLGVIGDAAALPARKKISEKSTNTRMQAGARMAIERIESAVDEIGAGDGAS